MKGYVVCVWEKINSEEKLKKYAIKAKIAADKYSGIFIIRGGNFENVLGKWEYARTVVIKFPSYETALNWYNSDEYKPVRKIREENSEGNVIIIEGK